MQPKHGEFYQLSDGEVVHCFSKEGKLYLLRTDGSTHLTLAEGEHISGAFPVSINDYNRLKRDKESRAAEAKAQYEAAVVKSKKADKPVH